MLGEPERERSLLRRTTREALDSSIDEQEGRREMSWWGLRLADEEEEASLSRGEESIVT